ncbi:DUF397 domain-containing protein [Streptomyces sp. 4N509B]|uniref:DUF397 domain-containing protein n=1 Tax=Streptomyces sp. 4N509B TaxID=3457413 RepID=UPI003FD4287C
MTGPGGADLAGIRWRRSSYTASNGQCVEVASLPGRRGIALRDSKHVHNGATVVSRPAWGAFVAAVRDGRLTV